MFISLVDWLGIQNNLKVPHIGFVKDNADPKKIGRLKILIPGLLEGNSDDLPWIYPLNPSFMGNNSAVGTTSIPNIGAELQVVFPYDDIYFGYYTGYWSASSNRQDSVLEDYPDQYGSRDETGSSTRINKAEGTFEQVFAGGSRIRADKEGNLTFIVKNSISIESADGKSKQTINVGAPDPSVASDASGVQTISPRDTLEIDTSKVNTTVRDELSQSIGKELTTIEGSKEINVGGGVNENISGSRGVAIVGGDSRTIGKDYSDTIAGKQDVTIGSNKTCIVIAGNISEKTLAGNIDLRTLAGNVTIDNVYGTMSLTALSAKLSAIVGSKFEASMAGIAYVDAPTMVQIGGAGAVPMLKGMPTASWLMSHTHITSDHGSPTSPPIQAGMVLGLLSTKVFGA